MRACPICDNNGKRVIYDNYDSQPMCLFECTACGHRYVDGLQLSQAWFDNYYLTQYTTDDKPYSDARLNSLADCVASYGRKNVLDIGGTDGELIKRLEDRKLYAVAAGVGTNIGTGHHAVILSHTLEHIYDVSAMMERARRAMRDAGLLFIEVPIHMGYKEPTAYDYHWQHVNKFRPFDLFELVGRNGFDIVVSMLLPQYREYEVWRIVGRKCNV